MESSNPIHINPDDGKYYFWDEVWCDRHGPYQTREEALIALRKYCRQSLMTTSEIESVIREQDLDLDSLIESYIYKFLYFAASRIPAYYLYSTNTSSPNMIDSEEQELMIKSFIAERKRLREQDQATLKERKLMKSND